MAQRRRQSSSGLSNSLSDGPTSEEEPSRIPARLQVLPERSPYVMMTLLALVMYGSWNVYYYQYDNLPLPLTAEQAGKRGFSELEALKHVKALAGLGPHPVGSDALDLAIQYVKNAAEKIRNTSHWEVDVDLDLFHVTAGANRLNRGLFIGKTLIYADMNHILLRLSPKYLPEARERAILVSSHIDSVFSGGGAGDCSSCIAVMLELARVISQWAHGFKNSVIFLFNTGEEEGLNGAHSFMTQHLWSDTVHIAIDLEAMGIGGKAGLFQTGPDPWAVQTFAKVAKYPCGQIMAQDLFSSGAIKSATDFQVYEDVGGLSGLDFAYTDYTAVYHTKNDKLDLLKAGSLQHLGENMMEFLLHAASSTIPPKNKADRNGFTENNSAIYFDILGMYMVVYQEKFGSMLYNSAIMQSLLIWTMSLLMGGFPAAVSLALSFFSLLLMWILSLSSSVLVAFLIPLVSSSAVPYITCPWLVIGLFGSPALLGALGGQHIGFRILKMYQLNVQNKRKKNLSPAILDNLAKLEAERWLFKSGLLQCLVLLIVGHYYKVGSSYLPLIWLASPAFAYGLLEATLSPVRLPRQLKIATLLIGYFAPILVSGGSVIRVMGLLIGTLVRLDRNPGVYPEWLGNVIVSVLAAAAICLVLVYLLSYIHLSDGKKLIVGAAIVLFGISLGAIQSGLVPSYTEDIARTLNVIHVVDTTGSHSNTRDPNSYVSLLSTTPGKLTEEVELIKEGFICGKNMTVDFVTFSMKYGCWTFEDAESGWSELDIPGLLVESNKGADERVTRISIDTKVSKRWSLAINMIEIEDFEFEGDHEELRVTLGNKTSLDGWHHIQFSGGKKAPSKFTLTLHWAEKSSFLSHRKEGGNHIEKPPLLKLRTDVNRLTPKAERVSKKLPLWSSPFGKSTFPYNLVFLTSLPVEF